MGISLNPATILSGQGVDVSTLVNQILSQKTGQLQQWQTESLMLAQQAGLLTSINNDLSTLSTAVNALADPLGALTSQAATSSDTGILTGTAEISATAGVHQIVVSNLATRGTIYTGAVTDGNTSFLPQGATTGDITLQVGGVNHDIQITQGSNDTLSTMASYLTHQNWGVTANVITDATGARLALSSQSTGTPGALAIAGNDTSLTFSTPAGGVNAALSIDGVPYSSTTNTIAGAISGVTLNLTGADAGIPVELRVGLDTSQVTQAINNFVTAYNQVIGDINTQFTVNAGSNTEGPLGSDTALRSLQTSLLNDVTSSISGNSGLVNLSSLGINMNNDGTLTVGKSPDGRTLQQVLTDNPTAVQNFFQGTASNGFANSFHSDLINLTDPTAGVLTVDLTQNQAQQKDLVNNIDNFEQQLTTQQQQLTAQFSRVNASLQAYPLLLQQVTQTLATLGTGNSTTSSAPTLTSGL